MRDLSMIALWIALLVVSMPLVHAQTLEISRASGRDNIDGVLSSPDTLKIVAKARITDDDQISPDQLRLKMDGFASYLIFSTCAAQGDSTQCEFFTDIFQAPVAPLRLTVQLMDDDGKFRDIAVPLKEVQKTVIGDTRGAYIESISASPAVSRDGRFSINFLARDEGTVAGDTTCSGIDKVDLKRSDGRLLVTQQGNKECSFAVSTEISISEGDGKYEVCAHPVDRLGKTDLNRIGCIEVIKDSGAPQPVLAQLFQQGERVEFLRPASDIVVDVHVEISDPSLDKASVRGDLSAITSSPAYRSAAPDEFIDDTAVWHDVPTNGMTECLVKLTARDTSGNSAEGVPVNCDTVVDNLGPRVVSMQAGINRNGTFFLPGRSVVNVVFEDDGVGISENDITLDLGQINSLSSVKPNTCVPDGDQLRCSWIVIASRTGPATIFVASSSSDRLGNTLREQFSQLVVIDNSPPTIENVDVQLFSGENGEEKTELLAVRDDTLVITALVRGAVSAEGNFSALGVTESVSPECDAEGTTLECIFRVTIEASGDSGEPVSISFFDEVGNEVSHQEEIPVFGVLDQENPNNWRVDKVVCSPDLIDDTITEFINFRVSCAALLKPLTRRAKIIHVDLDRNECTDDGALADVTLSNTVTGTKSPILNILLQSQKYTEPLNFTCPLRITTQVGKSITAFPEIENVEVNLGFFVNPLGEAGSQLDRKVFKAIKDAEGAFEIVGTLKTVMDYLEKACKIKSVFSNLFLLIDTIEVVIRTVGSLLNDAVITAPAGNALIQQGSATGEIRNFLSTIYVDKIFEIIDTMCVVLSCSAAYDSDDSMSKSVFTTMGGGVCTSLQKYLNSLIPVPGGEPSDGLSKGEDRPVFGQGSTDDPAFQRNPGDPQSTTARRVPPVKGLSIDTVKQAINVKDSIVFSIGCLCLPGIIHNIEKWHQLQCKYALCLGNEVREKGLPVSFCDEQKSYDECAFFFNQIFNAIPFSSVLSDFGGLLESLLTDPKALISEAVGIFCKFQACLTPAPPHTEGACYACKLIEDLSAIADAIIAIKTFSESLGDFFEVDDGFCGQMKDLKKEIKQEQATANAPAPIDDDPGLVDLADTTNPLEDREEFEEVVQADSAQRLAASRSASSATRGART